MKKFYGLLIAVLMFLSLNCDNNVVGLNSMDTSQMQNGRSIYLSQNYPNPCFNYTNIDYQLGFPMHVTLKIYTEDWVLVSTPVDKNLEMGYYELDFKTLNSKNEPLPSGNYYYTLEGAGSTIVKLMRIIN